MGGLYGFTGETANPVEWKGMRATLWTAAALGLCFAVLAGVHGQAPPADLSPIPRLPGVGPPPLPPAPPRPSIGEVAPEKKPPKVELLSVERIWDAAPHNAFTDLIRFRGRWYCTFREGSAHASPDGAVRIITSGDGRAWMTAFRISVDNADLRDPKLSITGDNRLMLSVAAVYHAPAPPRHQTLAWYSLDGRDWGIAFKIGDPDMWLWRVVWHRGSAYSMAYSTRLDRYLRMYVGPMGLRFQMVADRVLEQGKPSEATLVFNRDDSALCLVRRDGNPNTAMLGYSRPPYRGWLWRDLGVRLGGPDLLRLPDGRLVAAGRLYDPKPRTALLWLDETQATLEEFLTLPSGGDNSYPGLVFDDGLLWVSYYSSHEGKAAIYLAKVRLPPPEEPEEQQSEKLVF